MMDLVLKRESSKIHPKQFALLAACASIMMMFVAFSSAYIVRHAAGNWLEYTIPNLFYVSTIILLISSVTLHLSYTSFKKGKEGSYKLFLILTFLLGTCFVVCQYLGWKELESIGIYLTGNPSGSFFYIISGMHAAHVLGGITTLVVALMHAYMLKYKITPKRKLRFSLVLIYWHFMDFLWIYLFTFLILQQ